jgi:hypothetical protein
VESFALTITRSATQNYWLSPAGRRIADTVAGPSNPQGLVLGLIPYTPTTSPNSMINFRYVALLEQAHLRSTSFRKSPLSSNPESIPLSFQIPLLLRSYGLSIALGPAVINDTSRVRGPDAGRSGPARSVPAV